MSKLGIIDTDRLILIPEKFWSHHEFCFYLHDQLGELLVQYERSDAHNVVINAFESAIREFFPNGGEIDILQMLKEKGMVQFYKHHIVSHLVLGLTADLLHFLYESLRCFEKRKFAVGFSLLRKPLKENLLFLAWLLGNEDDFISRFEKNNYTTLNGVTPDLRHQLLSDAINRLATKDAFAPDLLEDMIFSKTHPHSFESVWQRATHLITSQGAQLRTEDLNINFIFHDATSDHFYELLYANLPHVLLFAVQLALENFSRIAPTNEQTTSHLIIASSGAYECLFEGKRTNGVTSMLRRTLKPFLKCLHCSAPLKLTRQNAIDMYFQERLTCRKCSLSSPLPLYWLMAQGKMKITRENGTAPILEEFRETLHN